MPQPYSELFIGVDAKVPLPDGRLVPYINFDNAASTPSLRVVQQAVDRFLVYYSSVHRGTGFKSQLSTKVYEDTRHIVLRFMGASPQEHTCIFVKNTTEAINKLAHRFPYTSQRNMILTSGMEHHSNDLPWRAAANTLHVRLNADGRLDENDFDDKLSAYGDHVALVAITGASNVTGFINPIHRLAEKTHRAGAMIFVDCAQLAPHRQVDMRPLANLSHLDFTAISAHKMYAPFGTGALIGRKDIFAQGDPDQRGGGTVEIVTLEDVHWAAPPDRDEAGSPNTVGAVALAAAICQLEEIGMQQVAAHEAELTHYALQRLPGITGLHIYGDTDPAQAANRLGVLPLILDHVPHFLTASILGHEYGIGVRSGCFCAHPYILHLLGLDEGQARRVRDNILAGDRTMMPGLIRASFGLYNTKVEIDQFVKALSDISKGAYSCSYTQDPASGEYLPQHWQPDFQNYFTI
jgi:cysteine desulfurase/selenocysteine lyase